MSILFEAYDIFHKTRILFSSYSAYATLSFSPAITYAFSATIQYPFSDSNSFFIRTKSFIYDFFSTIRSPLHIFSSQFSVFRSAHCIILLRFGYTILLFSCSSQELFYTPFSNCPFFADILSPAFIFPASVFSLTLIFRISVFRSSHFFILFFLLSQDKGHWRSGQFFFCLRALSSSRCLFSLFP